MLTSRPASVPEVASASVPEATPAIASDANRSLIVDVCLTGLLARSLHATLPGIEHLVAQLRSPGHTVRIVVVAIDPEDSAVDGCAVSHENALASLAKRHSIHRVVTVAQTQIDRDVGETQMLARYPFFRCHGRSRIKACAAIHIPNIMRHLQIERRCATYLDSSDADIAFSLSPDVLLETRQQQIVDAVAAALRDPLLVVPRCAAPKKYLVNGFAGGRRLLLASFLRHRWLDDKSKHPEAPINWERMCFVTLRSIEAKPHAVDVAMTKVRANGVTRIAWACAPAALEGVTRIAWACAPAALEGAKSPDE